MPPDIHVHDHELATALARGDSTAFEAIYRKHVSYLFRYLRRNISRKEDCEEIIQEIFESLWQRRESLRIETSLQAYLLGMARYKIIHYFRKSALKKKYTEHFLLFEAVYQEHEADDIVNASMQATLEKLMGDLPDRCQEALKLRLNEELSNGEIAHRMNISTRTVEGYMFRAFNHIRASYHALLGHH